jgi:hypothetical protein
MYKFNDGLMSVQIGNKTIYNRKDLKKDELQKRKISMGRWT